MMIVDDDYCFGAAAGFSQVVAIWGRFGGAALIKIGGEKKNCLHLEKKLFLMMTEMVAAAAAAMAASKSFFTTELSHGTER